MTDEELQAGIASLATHDDVRAEGERLLIDAIELLKYIDSTTR